MPHVRSEAAAHLIAGSAPQSGLVASPSLLAVSQKRRGRDPPTTRADADRGRTKREHRRQQPMPTSAPASRPALRVDNLLPDRPEATEFELRTLCAQHGCAGRRLLRVAVPTHDKKQGRDGKKLRMLAAGSPGVMPAAQLP